MTDLDALLDHEWLCRQTAAVIPACEDCGDILAIEDDADLCRRCAEERWNVENEPDPSLTVGERNPSLGQRIWP